MKRKDRIKTPKAITKTKDFSSLWGLTLILMLATVVYYNAVNGEFLDWDDSDVIVHNEAVKNLTFENALFFFTNIYSNDYRPVTFLSYGLIHAVWGLNPHAFHFFCILFHLINIVLVFFCVKRIANSKYVPLLTALIFAVHPMLVESVAWISAFNDVLFACFLLLALLSYTKYIREQKAILLFLTFLFSLLSLFTKPQAIVLPFLLLLFDYYFKRPFSLRLIYEKIPFFLLSGVFVLITFLSREAEVTSSFKAFALIDRFFFVFYTLSFYILKFVVPFSLSALHDFPVKENGLLPWAFYLSPLFIAACTLLLFRLKKHKQLILFGMLFFLINMGLVIQIIPFGKFIVAERYTYVPYMGLAFIVASFFDYYTQSVHSKYKPLLQAFFVAGILIFAVTAFQRVKVWENSYTLWHDVLKKNPKVAIAHNQLGLLHYFDGDLVTAKAYFDTAIAYNNDFYIAFNNRGNIYLSLNETEKAREDFASAVDINPSFAEAYYNMGYIKGHVGQTERAITYYDKAIENNPDYANAYFNRGVELVKIKQYEQAVEDFTVFIERDKNDPDAYFNRAMAYMNLQNVNMALNDLNTVTVLDPTNAGAFFNKGVVLLRLNNIQEACISFTRAELLGHPEAAANFSAHCH